jgi:hypothetical protein
LIIRPYDRPQAALLVELPHRPDPWLTFGDVRDDDRASPERALGRVTPAFVASAIRRASALGWNPDGDRPVMTIRDPE